MGTKMMVRVALMMMIGLPAMASDFTPEQVYKMASILKAVDDGKVTYISTESDDQTPKPLNGSETRFLVIGDQQIAAIHGKNFAGDEILNPETVFVKKTDGNTVSLADLVKSAE